MRENVYDTPAGMGAVRGVEVHTGVHRRISWGAIVAGVVLVLAVQLILSLLGLGIGMTTVDPAQPNGTPQFTSLTSGAGIWWTVSYMVALFVGGYVAARLAGVPVSGDGILHGLVTWALALLVSAWLVTTAVGSVIGGAVSAVGDLVGGATSAVQEVVPEAAQATGLSAEALQERARALLQPEQTQPADPEAARSELANLLTTIVTGSGAEAQQAADRAVSIIAQQAGVSEEQARRRLDELQQQLQQVREQATRAATQAAETTTDALSSAGIWGTVALLLGAVAAMIGGAVGTRRAEDAVVYAQR